jgi:leucyl aminopeptidase (aminopeptidase T)
LQVALSTREKYAKIAELVLERNLGVKKGDQVVVHSWEHTLDAAGEFYYAARRRGANPVVEATMEDAYFRAMSELSPKQLAAKNDMALAMAKAEDVDVLLAGPRDPARFKSVTYEKMTALNDEPLQRKIIAAQKRRGTRAAYVNIGQATPERARAYGIDYESWRDATLDALMVDPAEMARRAAPLIKSLRTGKEAKLRTSGGSVLRLKLAGRTPSLDDGVLRAADIRRGDRFVHLPAGTLFTAPLEYTAEGKASFDVPLFSRGMLIEKPWFKIEGGMLKAHGAAENAEELAALIGAQGGKETPLGVMTIGVNPAAKPEFVDRQMALGVVGLHFRDNDTFGGKLKGLNVFFGGFSKGATLEVDGKAVVKGGKLA